MRVSDDADGFKTTADQVGLDQQVGIAHGQPNTEALVARLAPEVVTDADGSLAALGITPAQAGADLTRLGEVVRERDPAARTELRTIHLRYRQAASPRQAWTETASLAYRLRLLTLDRWKLWERLVRYRTWAGPSGERLDGTNNATERAIGWWVKERSRTMRGYQRPASVLNVSRLIALGRQSPVRRRGRPGAADSVAG